MARLTLALLLSKIVLQNPLQIYSIEMQIEDVNDNAPRFSKNEFELEILPKMKIKAKIVCRTTHLATMSIFG